MENSMEIIFREASKALGQIACQKLMNEVFKEEEAKPKKAPAAKKKEKEDDAPAEARWTRWTKTYTDAFKKSLTTAGLNPDEKEFDKLKKEFVKYLNDLTEEDYQKDTKSHTDRMNDFATLKAPKKEAAKAEAGAAAAGGKAKAAPKKKTMWEEMNNHDAPDGPPSNAANIHTVGDIEELQNNEFLITVDGSPDGVFWDGKNGRWVRGPEAVDDEDLVEVKFGGVEYMVGEQSTRIYLETDNRDQFVGYVGVGKYRDMKMP
jgi:hypothetical protein